MPQNHTLTRVKYWICFYYLLPYKSSDCPMFLDDTLFSPKHLYDETIFIANQRYYLANSAG
jgi:hypothetical protein